ncbi:hypothetical protein TYRP_006090 [Tyrophagus putrescentiae]|nr:hypothetical protein TYRP_006090 [Tyrophagus putrescentiae]
MRRRVTSRLCTNSVIRCSSFFRRSGGCSCSTESARICSVDSTDWRTVASGAVGSSAAEEAPPAAAAAAASACSICSLQLICAARTIICAWYLSSQSMKTGTSMAPDLREREEEGREKDQIKPLSHSIKRFAHNLPKGHRVGDGAGEQLAQQAKYVWRCSALSSGGGSGTSSSSTATILRLAENDGGDAGKHLLEVLLQAGNVLAVADDLQQVLVADKVEAREAAALPLQVLAQRLLNLPQQVGEALQRPLHPRNVHHVHDHRILGDLLHQLEELAADRLEAAGLHGQQRLNVRAAAEDALQVDPPGLHVDPHVEDGVDAIQLLLPAEGVLLKFAVVGRELHRRDRVDVLLHLREEVVPAANDAALRLVVDQVQLVRLPELAHLLEELLQGHLALRHLDDVLDDQLVALQVNVPDLAEGELGEDPAHLELLGQRSPVALLQRVRLQLDDEDVRLGLAYCLILAGISFSCVSSPSSCCLSLRGCTDSQGSSFSASICSQTPASSVQTAFRSCSSSSETASFSSLGLLATLPGSSSSSASRARIMLSRSSRRWLNLLSKMLSRLMASFGLVDPATGLPRSHSLRNSTAGHLLLNAGVLPLHDLTEGAPLALDVVHVEPVVGKLKALSLQNPLPLLVHLHLLAPGDLLALQRLHVGDEGDGVLGVRRVNRLLLQLAARLADRPVQADHVRAEQLAELPEHLLVPAVVLQRHLRLHLRVVHHDGADLLARVGGVEGGAALLDLHQGVHPPVHVLAQLRVQLVRLQVPQRLVGEPLLNVVAHLADLRLDGRVTGLQHRLRLGDLTEQVAVLLRLRPVQAHLVAAALHPVQRQDDVLPGEELLQQAEAGLLHRGPDEHHLISCTFGAIFGSPPSFAAAPPPPPPGAVAVIGESVSVSASPSPESGLSSPRERGKNAKQLQSQPTHSLTLQSLRPGGNARLKAHRQLRLHLLVQPAHPLGEVGVPVQAEVVHRLLNLAENLRKGGGRVAAALNRPHLQVDRLHDVQQLVDLLLEVGDGLAEALHVRVALVRLPDHAAALGNLLLDVVLQAGDQQRQTGALRLDLLAGALIGLDGVNQRDGKGKVLIGLVGLVDDAQGDAKAERAEDAHLLRQDDDVGGEVDAQAKASLQAAADGAAHIRAGGILDGEDLPADIELALLHRARPLVKDRLRVQLQAEALRVALQLLPLDVVLPALAEDVLHALHVDAELALNLPRPDDGAADEGNVVDAAHAGALRLRVLHLELLVQRLDVVLHPLNQLRLVLANGAADVRPHEERIEAAEDAEHLIGVLRRAQLVAQLRGDARLDAVDALVVALKRRGEGKGVAAVLAHVQRVHLLHQLVGKIDLLNFVHLIEVVVVDVAAAAAATLRAAKLSLKARVLAVQVAFAALLLLLLLLQEQLLVGHLLEAGAEDAQNDRPQLLVLLAKLAHVLHAHLQLLVGEADAPDHLQVLVALLLDQVAQQRLKLLTVKTWLQAASSRSNSSKGMCIIRRVPSTFSIWLIRSRLIASISFSARCIGYLRQLNAIQVGGRGEVIQWKVLHQRIVVVHHLDGLLQAGVRVKADRGVEALAVLQNLQRGHHLQGLALLLNAQQRPLQIEPEANLLLGGA